MNKGIAFVLGTLVGSGIGAGIAAYILKDKYEREACDMIDEYHDRCEERILKIMEAYGVKDEDLESDSESSDNTEDAPVDPRDDFSNNEGVKKYHHYAGPAFTNAKVKGVINDMTKGQEDCKKYPGIDNCPDYIEEITEDDFIVDEKEFDDIHMVYDFNTDRLLMNPDTEDEIEAEEQLHASRTEIIGNMWKWSSDYLSDDDGTGAFYVRNKRIMKDIEVIVRYDPNQYVVEI